MFGTGCSLGIFQWLIACTDFQYECSTKSFGEDFRNALDKLMQ